MGTSTRQLRPVITRQGLFDDRDWNPVRPPEPESLETEICGESLSVALTHD